MSEIFRARGTLHFQISTRYQNSHTELNQPIAMRDSLLSLKVSSLPCIEWLSQTTHKRVEGSLQMSKLPVLWLEFCDFDDGEVERCSLQFAVVSSDSTSPNQNSAGLNELV